MILVRQRIKLILAGMFLLSSMSACLFAEKSKEKKVDFYVLPPSASEVVVPADTSLLKKMSEGIQGIAEASKKGLVYISVSKTHKAYPPGMIDPFEFFFGPRGRGNQRMEPYVQKGLGSGFILDLEKGYILTNNHVVAEADEISLKLANGHSYDGEIVGRDENTDIAVVKIKDEKFIRKGLLQLILGDSAKLNAGAFVVALGAPFQLEASITFGIISAVGRGSLQITQYGDFVQTDAAINPGNSGGPLIDMDGKVVGINTAIASKAGAYNGVGFAIPANFIRDRATQLINHGAVNRGFVGIGYEPLTDETARILKLPEDTKGVVVTFVKPDGPAGKAGIKKGDILVAIGKKPLQSASDISNIIGLMEPGTKTTVTLYRNGKNKKELSITVGHWPKSAITGDTAAREVKNEFGLVTEDVKDIESRQKEQFKVAAETGLFVTFVKPGSPAEKAGIKIGDVIVLVNMSSKLVKDPKAFNEFLSKHNKVVLGVERAGKMHIVDLKKSE